MKKNDVILFAVLLIIAAGLFGLQRLTAKPADDGNVIIYRDKEKVAEYSLNENIQSEFRDENGGSNLIRIQDGTVCIIEADCPDQICVKQGKISQNGQSIICLPHRLVVTVESGKKISLDGMVQ